MGHGEDAELVARLIAGAGEKGNGKAAPSAQQLARLDQLAKQEHEERERVRRIRRRQRGGQQVWVENGRPEYRKEGK